MGLLYFMNNFIPKFLPTLTVSSVTEANIICKILNATDINFIEITLRSSVSYEAIEIIAQNKDINLGLGTVLNINQLKKIDHIKPKFIVSPGFSEKIASYAVKRGIDYIPGVESATEIMKAYDHGYKILKFFPSELSGGIKKLQSLHEIFPEIKFLCTGGINLSNYVDYTKIKNVVSLGGSFVLPKNLVDDENIEQAINHLNKL